MKTEKIEINQIKVIDRARKDLGDIEELFQSIKELGLLQPPVVTEELVLVTGERRLAACRMLGWKHVEVIKVKFEDYLQQLKAERDENTCRKSFTFSEMVELGKKIEAVEKERAKEASLSNLKQYQNMGPEVEIFPPREEQDGNKEKTRDKVAKQVGFGSGKTYEKAKFVAEYANPEIIQKLNEEKISVNKAYQETKAKLEAAEKGKKDAEASAEAEKQRADRLAKRLQEAESAPPRVIEKVIEKPVVVEKVVLDPALLTKLETVKQEVIEKENALQELLEKQAKVKDFETQANKLSGEIANLLETKRKLEEANDERERIRKRALEFHAALRRVMRPLQEEWGNLEFLLKQCNISAIDAAEALAYVDQLRKIADTLEFHLSKIEGDFVTLSESGAPHLGRKSFEGVTVDVQPVRVGRA